jgi:enoyl-CoA hydratase
MRSDRRSSYRQWSMSLEEALAGETAGALEVIASGETVAGAQRYLEQRRARVEHDH